MVLLAQKYKLNSVCNAEKIPHTAWRLYFPYGVRTKINYKDSLAQDIDLVK